VLQTVSSESNNLYNIRALKHIGPLLALEASETFSTSIVGCKLDYCNCVLHTTFFRLILTNSSECRTFWRESLHRRHGQSVPPTSANQTACHLL